MVGTSHNASLALSMFDAGDYSHILSNEGSTRRVYLINGVVYKVERGCALGINKNEYNNIVSGPALPPHVFYPDVSLYNVNDIDIIAMEYVEGTAIYDCYCEEIGDECDNVCMTPFESDLLVPLMNDSSGMNVIRNEHGYFIIDAD